ncbi:MAG: SUMF1/EgtB/PvdO family nonheme iron enzyme [Vicinamibacterales bacterium]
MESPIGGGGMGEVYRGRDTKLGRLVAIKVLGAELTANPDIRSRFFQEAALLSHLSHANICTVFDVGEIEGDGTPFIVMEYLEGETLKAIIERASTVSVESALRYVEEVCEGLAAAHVHVIHRDIKPANIMVDRSDRVKLLDFGLARLLDAPGTSVFQFAGTPAYMAPEQYRGTPLTPQTDLFAGGAVAYELLTGNPAFYHPGDSIQRVMHRVLHEQPPALSGGYSGKAAAIQAILSRALAKNPRARFGSAREMASAIRALRLAPDWDPGATVRLGNLTVPDPAAGPSDASAGILASPVPAEDVAAGGDAEVPAALSMTPPYAGASPLRRTTPAARPRAAFTAAAGLVGAAAIASVVYVWTGGRDRPRVDGMVALRPEGRFSAQQFAPFWIDQTEVTNEDFRRFLLANPEWQKDRIKPELHDGDYLKLWNHNDFPADLAGHPVVYVSWYAAQAFAAWSGKRLPTDAEWVVAARGDARTRYWWGDDFSRTRANAESRGTLPAGLAEHRDPTGLADMLGNVWEWTGSAADLDTGATSGRTVRGGSWKDAPALLTLDSRQVVDPRLTGPDLGFRCAR